MVFKRSKTHNNFLLMFLVVLSVVTLISILSFTGCRVSKETEEQPVISEPESEGEVTEEEVPAGEEEDKIAGIEITGNINIYSGLDISDTVGNSRPIAIMVENSPDSRPQSGLIYADMVYEVVDEGGVTRYVAIYSSYDAEIIGPVRSARIYYAEIARSFDPIYTFWGTYPECYDVIKSLDMDVLDGNSDAYVQYTDSGWRDYSRIDVGEDTAHTAFMSTLKLKEDAAEYGYSLDGGQSPLRFKIDAVDSERGDISDITINFSNDTYRVDFEYNRENNNYLKFTGGAPHTDYETGKQIAVNNVIVMITNIEGPIDQYGHMAIRTTGASDIGKAFFFMDGNVIEEGTWERTSDFDPFKYKDDDGNIVLFNRGSTWVALIQDTNRLTY
ncbi:MAG: DUF3048 domain-containing protein [Chloroflexi bacterium]|nr:DUF3048 domain-containing protein [Chloroflexota bacterium]